MTLTTVWVSPAYYNEHLLFLDAAAAVDAASRPNVPPHARTHGTASSQTTFASTSFRRVLAALAWSSKAVARLGCLPRLLYWVVIAVLFVYSSVGSYSNTFEKLGPKTYCPQDHGGSGPCHSYMGSTTTCAWSRAWDVIYSSFFRTTWCISVGMILW